jgi:hypothetical protein
MTVEDLGQASEGENPFWRAFPSSDRAAAIVPAVNALYIQGIVPRVGADLGAQVSPALRWILFEHELYHLAMSSAGVGLLLRRLANAMYLVLHSLDEGTVLRIPSWRLDGNPQLAVLTPKLRFLLPTLAAEAGPVDEAICAASTLLHFRRSLSADPLELAKTTDEIGKNLERLDDETRALWDELTNAAWFRAAERGSPGRVLALLLGIGLHALRPAPETLRDWWQQGRLPPARAGDGPRARLRCLLAQLQPAATAGEAAERLASVSPSPLFGMAEEGVAPDPVAEVARALALDPDALHRVHPVGRALAFLMSGQTPRSDGEGSFPAASWSPIVPILTRDGGDHRCRFLARFACGRLAAKVLSGELDVAESWRRWARGGRLTPAEARLVGRLTIMPAPPEVTLLWDLQRIMEDLVRWGRLRCLCGSARDPAAGCARGGLLSRVYRQTRTEWGDCLPPPSCLAAN